MPQLSGIITSYAFSIMILQAKYKSLGIIGCLCVTLLCVTISLAQQSAGFVFGTVKNEKGETLNAVVIEFRLERALPGIDATGYQTVRVSDDKGIFKVENLPPGIYSVKASYFGRSYKNEDVRVYPSQKTNLDIRLAYEGCEKAANNEAITLTDADKSEIINQVLKSERINKSEFYTLLREQKKPITLSTENIKAGWVKPLPKLKLAFMSEQEIQDKADRKGDFLYLSFNEFEVSGGCVIVTLTNSWAVGKKSGMAYLSGGGSIYAFRKVAGKWISRSAGGWIS